ncbi:MAG: D-alanyl-D-alanine carboxypeptidase/D-alanyl-D-alanine-endopeptidase [Rhodoferax sp.]|nr:D-alanyl-D-alanine carboxypeptidase/D-alanyl-D-alanine-endopeptidase [Rhodoferax sp.]
MFKIVNWLVGVVCLLGAPYLALAQIAVPPALVLPTVLVQALQRAQVPLDAVSVLVTPADGALPALVSHQINLALNPASAMKLLTTFAALELLGPTYTWRTPVWLDGPVRQGVLHGNLVIQGQGDPSLVLERLWLLLRRVQALGVRRIGGDMVLERSAFDVPASDPAAFDGEPLRPYNASADALLVNYKAIVLTFTPDASAGVAWLQIDPPLAGVKVPASVPLARGKSALCGDYRSALQADWSDPQRVRFGGHYPADCGEKVWSVAYTDPASYNARALAGLWRSMGGQFDGQVRDGAAPQTLPSFVLHSPPLAVVIRDINKFSNNVMAQQVFYTLGLPAAAPEGSAVAGVATPELARQALRQWWLRRIDASAAPVIDNGSGLSRQSRISAQQLGQLLQRAYASPYMPELMASLPIVGLDGTLKRSQAGVTSAHLKTGSLQGVLALAGFVHSANGRPLCLVAIVNHPNAAAARPALDALVDWAAAQNGAL